jgi:predicted hotdog family 3-hydroxylacyl-ACP dehydratase
MSAAAYPELAELLPHSGPMRLLERVLAHSPERTVCALDPSASELFRDGSGSVPAWVALEWMAQCIAAHGGLVARGEGRAPSPGMLVGAKRLALERAHFAAGESLEVEARFAGGAGALASFECALRAGSELVATGSLSVYVSDARARAPGAAS